MNTPPHVLSMVLAGGEGKRLAPLTLDRAKPAVPFGGHYRLVDFALSNLVNGGFRRIVVLTQYKSHSLDVHLSRSWQLAPVLGNYVVGVPAQMRKGPRWYLGSADAIFQNLNIIDDERPTHVIVFGADHIYRMDPRQMLEQHIESGAGLTVAGLRVPLADADQFGVIEKGADTRITAFREKPTDAVGLADDPTRVLASMGNYLFDADLLRELVSADADDDSSNHDMGGDIVPRLVESGDAHVYDLTENEIPGASEVDHAYWRDVGTLDAYFDANMDLVAPEPSFNLYNSRWPIITAGRLYPPAKQVEAYGRSCDILNAMICSGSVITGARVHEAVVSPGVRIEAGADVERAVLLDEVEIGAGATLRNVILDKHVVVPDGYEIGVDPAADAERFDGLEGITRTESGLVVIGKGRELPT